MTDNLDPKRELDADGNPLATTAGPDPGNTDPTELVTALDPDDDIYDLVEHLNQQQ
jgi:hypothetical protein